MTTFVDVVYKPQFLGAGEEAGLLRTAVQAVDQQISDLIRKNRLQDRDGLQLRSQLWPEARKAVLLTPIQGLALCLHDLNRAATGGETNKKALMQAAVAGIEYYREQMEKQTRGRPMPQTQAFFEKCDQRIKQLDPKGELRHKSMNGLPGIIIKSAAGAAAGYLTGGNSGFVVGAISGLFCQSVQQGIVSGISTGVLQKEGLIALWLGLRVRGAVLANFSAYGVYRSLKGIVQAMKAPALTDEESAKKMYAVAVSTIGVIIPAIFLYLNASTAIYG